ncbi:MAG: DoxX family protein [Gammaproteobacteria bacterium]|nr:DoxX family protein [Gammaproteobacteria bacterium]
MVRFGNAAQGWLDRLRVLDFLGPLALRLYLVPIFWMAGTNKIDFSTLRPYEGTTEWFAGIGIPFPAVNAFLAGWTEVLGALMLLAGLATRWIAIPLMFTMVVAIASVHWQNGWLAIAEGSGLFATERTMAAVERLGRAKEILQEHGNYDWLTEFGSLVMLNNGIEFAGTYFIMLLALFFMGGGNFVSADYWIARRLRRR